MYGTCKFATAWVSGQTLQRFGQVVPGLPFMPRVECRGDEQDWTPQEILQYLPALLCKQRFRHVRILGADLSFVFPETRRRCTEDREVCIDQQACVGIGGRRLARTQPAEPAPMTMKL